MTRSFASEIAVITEIFTNEITKTADENLIKKIKQNLYLYGELHKGDEFVKNHQEVRNSLKNLQTEIRRRINFPFNLEYLDGRSFIKIEIGIPEGVLSITASRKRIIHTTTNIFIIWMIGSNLLLLLFTILFMRNQIRPILRLSNAADKFGKGISIKDFKLEGASEIRKAAFAFLKMRSRIERHVSQRTEMLAGVSHDIRTPLTRIKLQIAMMETNPEIKEIEEDISEIEQMIKAYLAFAKDQALEEEAMQVNFSALIQKVISSYQNHEVKIIEKLQPGLQMKIKALAMKRAVRNVLENALRFGSSVEVKLFKKDGEIHLEISDDGPGVAPEQYEDVFRPFFRIESSRNQETGGIGLGLAITRDIVNGHGGEISLAKSKLGGLTVEIILPLV